MSTFVPLAERIIDAILEADPRSAMYAGDHRFDGRLPDLSPDGVGQRVAMLRDAGDALASVDDTDLDDEDRVDLAVLGAIVDRQRFELTEVREHTWNPLAHNPGVLLNALVSRPYAPVAERLLALAERLDAVPDALATARATLRDCPAPHLETAVEQFEGVAELVRTELPPMLARTPGLRGTVTPTADRATGALDEFVGWLRRSARSAGRGADARDPRLGRRLWEARLWHTLDSDLSAGDVLAAAWSGLDDVTARLREAAAELVGGKADDETVRRALDQLGSDHPNDDTVVGLAGRTLADATEFVRERGLVSLVDDPVEVRVMPEFARGVAVAYCDPPGAMETATVPTFYCIAPAPAAWTPDRVESFYREYNNHMIRNLTVHEAMPGHFLQLAHSRRFRGSTRARSIGLSGPFVEGWAVYAEQVMADHGFGGPPIRVQRLKMQLRVIVNALIDQLIHCEEMSEPDAMALMTERGFQEEGEAAGKWRRAQLTSAQLSTYFAGYLEMSAIGAARPAGVGVREWHDAMLAHGSPPPRHARSLLGV